MASNVRLTTTGALCIVALGVIAGVLDALQVQPFDIANAKWPVIISLGVAIVYVLAVVLLSGRGGRKPAPQASRPR